MPPRKSNGDQGCLLQVTGTREIDNFEIILIYGEIHLNSLWSWGPGVFFLEDTDSPGRTLLSADVQDPGRHPTWPSLEYYYAFQKTCMSFMYGRLVNHQIP